MRREEVSLAHTSSIYNTRTMSQFTHSSCRQRWVSEWQRRPCRCASLSSSTPVSHSNGCHTPPHCPALACHETATSAAWNYAGNGNFRKRMHSCIYFGHLFFFFLLLVRMKSKWTLFTFFKCTFIVLILMINPCFLNVCLPNLLSKWNNLLPLETTYILVYKNTCTFTV